MIARSLEDDKILRANVGAEASASSPIPLTNETGTGTATKTALSFEVDRPGVMVVSPTWANSHDSTSPGTPSLALKNSSYLKAVESKAATSSLSGGNFFRSVFVSRRRVRVCVRCRNHCSRRRHRRHVHRRCVQPTARYQQRGEDVLVVVVFVALRESLGTIQCFGSLLLAKSC